jgi:hypothetical protein
VPNVVESREGWELCIVTGAVMDIPTITPPITIYISHPCLPPTTLGIYLSRIMFDFLMVAF